MPLSPRARTTLVSIYAIAAAALSVSLLLAALPTVDASIHAWPDDGSIDWIGARAFFEHVNPFSHAGQARYNITKCGFGHPPTTPFWFLPLFRWGVVGMGVVLGYLTLILLALHLVIISYELDYPAPPATVALVLAAVLCTSWFQYHLHLGQLSEAIAFLYVLAWYFLRRNRQYMAGAMLGLATTLKLFPGLMVAFLLVTRRWRAFAAACASWLVIAVVMTWRYGLAAWPQFFRQQRPLSDRWIANLHNMSLQGIVLRGFWPGCGEGGPTLPAATAIALAISILLVGAAWWIARPALRDRIDLPYALFALLSTFINPWVWEHYNVFLILPLLLVVVALWRGAQRGMPLGFIVIAVAALLFVVWGLSIDRVLKDRLLIEYNEHHLPAVHHRLHFYEVMAWLPQVVLMILLAALIAWQERRGRGGEQPLIAAPPA